VGNIYNLQPFIFYTEKNDFYLTLPCFGQSGYICDFQGILLAQILERYQRILISFFIWVDRFQEEQAEDMHERIQRGRYLIGEEKGNNSFACRACRYSHMKKKVMIFLLGVRSS
ncbi:hypothetical protein ACJX0J_040031, partial [Zea mays]